MHLGGREVGGRDCVFMRMRYSRPAQSVPFVSLHYCTMHSTQTVLIEHYTHCTIHNTVQHNCTALGIAQFLILSTHSLSIYKIGKMDAYLQNKESPMLRFIRT